MNSDAVKKKSEEIYSELKSKGIAVLYDDRTDASAGFKFKDADLLGMPLQVIVGEKNLKNNGIGLKDRNTGKRWNTISENIIAEVVKFVNE